MRSFAAAFGEFLLETSTCAVEGNPASLVLEGAFLNRSPLVPAFLRQ